MLRVWRRGDDGSSGACWMALLSSSVVGGVRDWPEVVAAGFLSHGAAVTFMSGVIELNRTGNNRYELPLIIQEKILTTLNGLIVDNE